MGPPVPRKIKTDQGTKAADVSKASVGHMASTDVEAGETGGVAAD